MKNTKNKRGISLIVLVITIIVMIILAAAIILSLSSSGIIGRANEAKEKSNFANAKQIVMVAEAEWKLDEEKLKEKYKVTTFKEYANKKLNDAGYATGEGNNKYFVTDLGNMIYSGNNTLYIDSNGNHAVIPGGFEVSQIATEDEISEGLVIYEIPNEHKNLVNWSDESAVQTTYNQYVWIPVDSINTFSKMEWGDNFSEIYFDNLASFDVNNISEAKEYEELVDSVEKNGGFYIARYEAGLPEGITTGENGTANYGQLEKELTKPVSIKGANVWSDIPWDSNWVNESTNHGSWNNPGCTKVARDLYNNSSFVASHLIYEVEWDAALKFISKTDGSYATNSEGKGWYIDNSGEKINVTGQDIDSNASNMLSNIYDMAGNVFEWTMETFDGTDEGKIRVVRGSSYSNYATIDNSACSRCEWSPEFIDPEVSFRVALYLK